MKPSKHTTIYTSICISIAALAFHACSSGGASSALSGLSDSVLSSPFGISTSTSSTELSIQSKSRTFSSSYADRKDVIAKMLKATSLTDCEFDIESTAPTSEDKYADCYGPNLLIKSGTHADGSYPAAPNSIGMPSNPLPVGDVGIWSSSTTSGEACTAAQITKLVDSQTKFGYLTQLTAARLYCFANINSVLPKAAGDKTSLDATQLASLGFTKDSKTFDATSAVIEGVNDSGSNFGYKMTIEGTMRSKGFSMVVQYADQTDEGFAGTASYVFRDSTAATGGCSGGSGVSFAGKMGFSRADAKSNVKVQLDHAIFCGTTYSPLTKEGGTQIDPCDRVGSTYTGDSDSANGWAGDYNRVVFNYDPDTQIGTYSYAWQAGKDDGNTRVFNAEIKTETTGVGYFGFGTGIGTIASSACSDTMSASSISKMVCNWAGPGNSHTGQSYVQYQPMKRATTKDSWTVDTGEKITYAPQNSCDTTGSTSLEYCAVSSNISSSCPTSGAKSNDCYTGTGASCPTTRLNLESLSTYTSAWSAPSSPDSF